MHASGRHRRLSCGLVADIERCDRCGLIHLHIGALTLRLQPSALHDLRHTLDRALEVLHQDTIMPGHPHMPSH